jgi:hypothetical protein
VSQTDDDIDEAREEGRQEIRDAVQRLWHELNGWIPGASRIQLCDALGVDGSFLDEANGPRTSRSREIPIG